MYNCKIANANEDTDTIAILYNIANSKIANANEATDTHTRSKWASPLAARFNCAHLLWYWNSYTRPLNMWLGFSRLLKSQYEPMLIRDPIVCV